MTKETTSGSLILFYSKSLYHVALRKIIAWLIERKIQLHQHLPKSDKHIFDTGSHFKMKSSKGRYIERNRNTYTKLLFFIYCFAPYLNEFSCHNFTVMMNLNIFADSLPTSAIIFLLWRKDSIFLTISSSSGPILTMGCPIFQIHPGIRSRNRWTRSSPLPSHKLRSFHKKSYRFDR